ncbi:MAG TPA: DUF5947 family protein [Chthonomonadaceae bacterium]|nr:DUF5947 family protein [Chthonomonadaceae bacterium]
MPAEPPDPKTQNPFGALRRFARQAASRPEERCDLCGDPIGPEHRHLLNLASREVLCSCRACMLLFDHPAAGAGARRLIPTRVLSLPDFALTNAQWESLEIPVNMAFFFYSTPVERVVAVYPSPMGPTESLLPLTAWSDLAQHNPILEEMEPDVEALLVRRERENREYYLVPMDTCYRLVGLIRLHWRGFSGGSDVRKEIERFFVDLKERATPMGGVHA